MEVGLTVDPHRVSAGNLEFSGGVDSSKSPNLLNNNQLAWGTNVTLRGGFAKARPGWKKIDLGWPDVAGSLSELRWNMPCLPGGVEAACPCVAPADVTATLLGDETVLYDITLQIRGVVELAEYTGGSNDGAYFQTGGTLDLTGHNGYKLTVSDPPQDYWLNRGTGPACVVIGGDSGYECVIQANGGAMITLHVDLGGDTDQITNYTHLVVPDISPAPDWFDGQFLHMDVVSVMASDDTENVQTNFEDGRFQVSLAYAPNNGTSMICAMIGGRLFRINVDSDNSVNDISILGDLNPSNIPHAWATQAENYLIIQDGQTKALIYNGGTSRRASATLKEVPVGNQIAYGMGRIWIARNNEYIAGDINGGPTSVLQFTETGYLNEGGSFIVPLQSGQITGLKFISSIDTSLGQGELVIFTENSVFSNRVPPNRSAWKDSSEAIQRIVQIDSGGVSHRSVSGANSDLFYRSKDGIQSLIIAVRQFNSWGNTPISAEMNRIIENDDTRLLSYASSIKFDNRLLMTCSPVDTSHGVYHRALIELDFDLISSMANKLPPAYDGISTGLNILQLVDGFFSGVHRAFAFVLNSENKIELWERSVAEKFDNGSQRIQWTFETPSYNFGNPFDLKQLNTADIFLDELTGEVDIEIQFKSDQTPYWTTWHSWSECSKKDDCSIDACGFPKEYRPQFRSKVHLPQPPDTCDPTNSKPLRNGYEFQFRFVITGYCRIKQLRFHAYTQQESPNGDCPTAGTCFGISNCGTDNFSYTIEG